MRDWRAIICGLLILAGGAAVAQDSARIGAPLSPISEAAVAQLPVANAQLPVAGAAPLHAEDVNAWLDGLMPYALGRAQIPGAVVVVVKDGQILTKRGYGYANVAKRVKVDPARTLFRPGSISKLFTWTAVMQQVEQGKLDLDKDVNAYLDFMIPPYQGKPITLRNIMTHTAGFEEQVKDILSMNAKTYVPYDQLLKRWVPNRVYAPGSTPAYSNYATALAGYIVQRVSGEPFDSYTERHIFAPLGMTRSSFRQPLPRQLAPLMSEGYRVGSGKGAGFEFVGPSPAGSLSASGEDMGKFMIAHLQLGAKILRPQTAQLMHARANQPIPGLNGMALGFYESSANGHRVIAHGGDTALFHSDLHLLIDDGVGLYVSFNSSGKEGAAGSLRAALFDEFADRYFPAPPAKQPTLDAKAARESAEKLAGTWSMSRRSYSSFVAIADLLGQTKIGVGKDGELIAPVIEQLSLSPRKWIAEGPMLWRDANSGEKLGATLENGRATRFSLNTIAPIIVFYRTPWYANSAWLLPLLYLSLAVLALTALLWPSRAIVRRRFGAALAFEGRSLQAFRASRIAALAILAALIAWTVTFTMMSKDVNFGSAFTTLLVILGIFSLIAFVGGTVVMVWYMIMAWRNKWPWTAKLWSVLLVISAATVLLAGIVFNLVGWQTNF
jgi:CubicO group peptidase (beta-lactamase class C family)